MENEKEINEAIKEIEEKIKRKLSNIEKMLAQFFFIRGCRISAKESTEQIKKAGEKLKKII